MDRALKRLVEIKGILRELRASRRRARQDFTDATIVLLYYLSVVNNQTQKWACDPAHWPFKMPPGGLPSPSQLSRRLRKRSMVALLDRVERAVRARDPVPADRIVTLKVDGRGLMIGPNSHDRHAKFGRAASVMARGYKLHATTDDVGRVPTWKLTGMNGDERAMAVRMVKDLALCGYLLADTNYDSTQLFGVARTRGLQLVAPRRTGGSDRVGRRKQDPARLRSRDMLETPHNDFARTLYRRRGEIERTFRLHACTPELLTHIPTWVRSYPSVRRWVQTKLTLAELHRQALAQRKLHAA